MSHTIEDNALLLKCVQGMALLTKEIMEAADKEDDDEELKNDLLSRFAIAFLSGASCGLHACDEKTAAKWLQEETDKVIKDPDNVPLGLKRLLQKLMRHERKYPK